MSAFVPNRTLKTEVVASATTFLPTTTAPLYGRAETTAGPELIGFTFVFGTFSAWHCLTGTWFGVSGYGRCCPSSTDCPVYTTCVGGSILSQDKFSEVCKGSSSQTVCVTGTIYESIGDPSPRLYVGCWPSWTAGDWNATRTVPVTGVENIITPVTSPPTPPPTISTTSGGSSSATFSKGTLAALILGLVVLIALSVGLSFLVSCLWTRRKKKRAKAAAEAGFDITPLQMTSSAIFQRHIRAVGSQEVEPLRPQTSPAELEVSHEIISVVAEPAASTQSSPVQDVDATIITPLELSGSRHRRRASELDGKEILPLSEIEAKQIKRPPDKTIDGEQAEVTPRENGRANGRNTDHGLDERHEDDGNPGNDLRPFAPRRDRVQKDTGEEANLVVKSSEPGPSNTPQTEDQHTVVNETIIGNGKMAVR